jgi:hypothetical protein
MIEDAEFAVPDATDVPDAATTESGNVAFDCLEYESGGETWRVELGGELAAKFELRETDQVALLHRALFGQEPTWMLVRRLYGIAPMLGVKDPDDLRVWPLDELAQSSGIAAKEIEAHVAGAVNYWRRWLLQNEGGAKKKKSTAGIATPLPPPEEIDQLLRTQGFVGVEDQPEREYIAQRIIELEEWLDDPNLRATARSAIQQEVQIFFVIEPTIRTLRAEAKSKENQQSGTSEKKNTALMTMMKERREAQSALEATLKGLGVMDSKGSHLRKRMEFSNCLGGIMDAMKLYYSDNDHALIDGLMTAAEVELMTTPVYLTKSALRPAQYRADLTLMVSEAAEHFWEREWSPTPLSRRMCRRLREGFRQGINFVRSDEGEVIEDPDDMEISEPPTTVSQMPVGGGPNEANQNAAAMPLPRPRASKDEDVAVIV